MEPTQRYVAIMKTFSSQLRKARAAAGFKSAQQFAGTLGMEPHAYRKYERGESEPNYETLTRICELLKITPNDLLPLAAKSRTEGPKSSPSTRYQAA